jgi:ankyrin repeat protein
MLAASHGERDLVLLLVRSGANLDAMADNGATALRLAEAKGHGSVATLLKQLGAADYGDMAV